MNDKLKTSESQLISSRKYRLAHPDRVKESRDKSRSKPESITKSKEYRKLYNDSHREQNRLYARKHIRNSNLRRRFGIDEAAYDSILELQGGVCAICGKSQLDKRLAVDHDHGSGKIRGLLCTLCNTALGKIEPVGVEKFVTYLSSWRET